MKAQVIIPMSGVGQRFLDRGYKNPKPLLEVGGKPLIEWLIRKFPKDWRFVFIANKEHLKKTRLRAVLKKICPQGVVVGIDPHKKGPVYTVAQALSSVRDDWPTFVNYCDFSFTWDPDQFATFFEFTQCDGAIFCYRGFHAHYLSHTLYAYCREKGGRIQEVREKGHFTPDRTQEYASSGTYFFSTGRLVKQAFRKALKRKLILNGEYYVSLVYNLLIEDKKDVRVFEIPHMLQWGTPDDLEDYNYWHRTFQGFNKFRPEKSHTSVKLIMPMAGRGSRFGKDSVPKPLRRVLGEPMFKMAKTYFPCRSDQATFVVRDAFKKQVAALEPQARLVSLKGVTEGQAITTLKGLRGLPSHQPVLVSACDHGLLWDPKAWQKLMAQKPDVVVLGQRGYPGARRKPTSYSYIATDSSQRIEYVSVKAPLQKEAHRDLLLVGSFYFARVGRLKELIHDLVRKNIRVNGEFYLDSVINLAVAQGWDVRAFETQAYMNWGDPDALKEFLYWHGYFQGLKWDGSN